MAPRKEDTIAANWRCFVACGIIIMSPFQYGIDFGLIGGLQAMVGFLEVRLRCPVAAMKANLAGRYLDIAPPTPPSVGTSRQSDSS